MNIVVKLPNDIEDRILSFPFLHILNQYLEERMQKSDNAEDKFQLHLISLGEGIEILNLLPFHAYYHELQKEDLISIFSVHRGCSDFKLPSTIDIFISTTESMVDASIGKNLGAKEKIGFTKTFNNIFLSKQIQRKELKHRSEQICELAKPLTGFIADIPICSSRTLENEDKKASTEEEDESRDYILLDIDILDDTVNPVWKDLFSLVSGVHFILFSSKVEPFQQELWLTQFIKNQRSGNTFEFFRFESHIELSRKIYESVLCATTNPEIMLLSSYVGRETVFFNKDYNFGKQGSQYLRGDVVNALINDYDDSDGFSEGFDHILSVIESRIQNSKKSD